MREKSTPNESLPSRGSEAADAQATDAPDRAQDAGLAKLESALKVLSHLNRLRLLSILRTPRTLDEIHLTPGASRAGDNPERPLAGESVREHLDQLVAAGIVRSRTTDRKGKRPVREFVVDHARLYAVAEEVRKLSSLAPFVRLEPFETTQLAAGRPERWDEGPKVILVHGVKEGVVFPLRTADLRSDRGWTIGRKGTSQICLEYDPYVSHSHAEIVRTPKGFRLIDLRTARNGTFLNWQRLPVGGEEPIRSGDIIGLGRSILVFRET